MSIKQKLQELAEKSETIKASQEVKSLLENTEELTLEQMEAFAASEEFKALSEEEQAEYTKMIEEAKCSDKKVGKEKSAIEFANGKGKSKEDKKVDITEDIEALFNGETLDEEFKTKATTIFEAAVISRVKAEAEELDEIYSTQIAQIKEEAEQKIAELTEGFESKIASLEEEFAQKLEEQVEEMQDGLVEHVDGFLNFMVEQWISDNNVALESGIKSEIAENLMSGLHKLFTENYVTVPEEKVDLVAEMETKLSEALEKLDEQVKANIDLTKTINEGKRASLIEKATDGLTDIDAEKFRDLVEELSFENPESFEGKLTTIKENYFTKKVASKKIVKENVAITNEPVEELNEEVKKPSTTPLMDAYLKQLSKK